MRKLVRIFFILLLLTCLAGCSASNEATESTAPADVTQPTQATTLPTEPATEPATEAPTEPPLALDKGPRVFINGIKLTSTVLDGDILYVSAAQFCQALGGTTDESGTSHLEHSGVMLTFSNEYSHMLRDSKAMVLSSPVLSYQDEAYLPLEELCEMVELSVLHDPEADAVYCTAAAWKREIPEGYDVPVFMYHAVDNDLWGIEELFVKPEMMEEQLKYLTENGYDTIFFEDLYHIEDYDKPVILTFDDGYLDNYTQLYPLLQKYNAKATIFVIDQYIGVDPHYLNREQIREMADSGLVSIQSHTVSHPDLDELTLEVQREELERSKLLTARLSLREPYVLCYPTGKYNNDTLSIIDESYHFGIKMRGGLYNTSDDPYLVNRYYVARSDTLYWFTSTLEGIFG